MMTLANGKKATALCRRGKNQEAIDRFYARNVGSVEARAMPGIGQVQRESSPSR